MTDLRKAAEQALEALDDAANVLTSRMFADAAAALRAALAQKAEPVAWRTFDGEGGYDYRTYDDNENYRNEWDKRNPNHKGWVEPLYAAPPAAAERERMKSEGWRHCAEGQRTTQFCGLLDAAVKAEREACAKVCTEQAVLLPDAGPLYCANAIRARGK